MITSKDVIGPERDPTMTPHVYASLLDKNGEHVAVCLMQDESQASFDVQGRIFERMKERDENSRIVFREKRDPEPEPVAQRKEHPRRK